jgi:DNA processing protein
VAIVGTRAPTSYGRQAAGELARGLSQSGVVIISGMARGIDTAAHVACLDAGGETIGVLGHGIDQMYPPEARRLFERVRRVGLLLTEYPPGETPRAGNFPRRNRLITALSRGVIIVEMSHRSGAQHSVSYALEQGKEVLAVPGPIDSPASEGTNQLIKDGARMVTSSADVLEELFGVGSYQILPARTLTSGSAERPSPQGPVWAEAVPSPLTIAAEGAAFRVPALSLFTPAESRLLDAMQPEPLHIDILSARAGVTSADAMVLLLELELRGAIQSTAGMRYCKPHGSAR